MSEKILDIKEERLSFFTPAGEVKALNGVSFAMNQGDVLGIVGESGSGKSVTAYSVMGLTAYPGKLVGGTVWFNGHEIEKMKEKDFLFMCMCTTYSLGLRLIMQPETAMKQIQNKQIRLQIIR